MKRLLAIFGLAVLASACSTLPKHLRDEPSLAILPRAEWGANAAGAEMKPHRISHITIHHTATLQKPERPLAEKMRALQKFSQNPGTLGNGKSKPAWPDVPYHYYIDCRGDIAEGRDAGFVGDTNTSYDPTGHLLVVLEGNFEEEQPTPEQLDALRRFVRAMARRHHVASDRIGGHKDFAETLCPGKNLQAMLPAIREQAAAH